MNANRKRSSRTSPERNEVPELDAKWISGADYYEGKKLIRRGRPRVRRTAG